MLIVSGVAALTTFTLYQQDQSEGNKIYAESDDHFPNKFNKKLALGLTANGNEYLLSLNFRF